MVGKYQTHPIRGFQLLGMIADDDIADCTNRTGTDDPYFGSGYSRAQEARICKDGLERNRSPDIAKALAMKLDLPFI